MRLYSGRRKDWFDNALAQSSHSYIEEESIYESAGYSLVSLGRSRVLRSWASYSPSALAWPGWPCLPGLGY